MKNLVIITGPSAVGKTTVAKEIFKLFPALKSAVTYTTREARNWSQEDKLIHHLNKNEFQELIKNNKLIEWAEVYGEFYGTGKEELLNILEQSPVLLNIDVQGAKNIKQQFPDSLSFFIQPDSLEILKKRIDARPISQEIKDKRWQAAQAEMAQKAIFNYQITNIDGQLEETVAKISQILKEKLDF